MAEETIVRKAFLKIKTDEKGVPYLEHNGVKYSIPVKSHKYMLTGLSSGFVGRVMEDEKGTLIYKHSTASRYKADAVYSDFLKLMNTRMNVTEKTTVNNDVVELLKKAVIDKPKELIISDVKWKYLVRNAVRALNIMMTGPSGCGKTVAAKSIQEILPDWNVEIINVGSTQDPRATLIGNTHFNKDEGTYFSKSAFVKAITTPKTIVILDELSRAHPDAWNILMSVLDYHQRYIRLDEADNSPKVQVAEDVCFVATANIGNEYTATKVMDRALLDRFTIIEMDVLTAEQELENLTRKFPNVQFDVLQSIAEIAGNTRTEILSETPNVSTIISTRLCEQMAACIEDGFTLMETAEVCVYPFYEDDGGTDNERTYMKQLVQRYIPADDVAEGTDEVFNTDDSNMKYERPF